MSESLGAPVLVLNRNYYPVRVTTVRHAFLLLYLGRASALDSQLEPQDFESWASIKPKPGEDYIGTPRGRLAIPRVVLLKQFNRVPSAPLRLSRRNLFLRDNYTCQYCLRRASIRELNVDHVLPRSRGGPSSWDNLVTSCRECNLRKGRSTPEECGMKLRKRPGRPAWSTVVHLAGAHSGHAQWEPFLMQADALRTEPAD